MVEIRVITLSRWLRLITFTKPLIILDITKTESVVLCTQLAPARALIGC